MGKARAATRIALTACAVLCSASVTRAQSPAADSVARLDSAWARSYAVHDTAAAQAIFAPDLVVVGGNGMLKDREGELRDVRPQAGLRMHYFRTLGTQVRCYPAACAVVGVAEWEFEFNGRVDATRRRYSAMWVRGGSLGWQMVSLHISTALPQ
ncbi:MAG TPA: nuclear transport factor 2 family protein [Gemmatimonadales bacterium]|nr:nuclear transport factor 2 family protein [Gemmatimonadales bacterium]